jgi:hypothetical protein
VRRGFEISGCFGFQTSFHMLAQLRRYLKSDYQEQERDHSGSFTVTILSAVRSGIRWRWPLGQSISTVARVSLPRPKCTRASLAER